MERSLWAAEYGVLRRRPDVYAAAGLEPPLELRGNRGGKVVQEDDVLAADHDHVPDELSQSPAVAL